MTAATHPVPCPHCGSTLDLSAPTCATCGLHLRGPRAARLWQIDQQLEALTSERSVLMEALLAGPDTAPQSTYLRTGDRSGPSPSARPAARRSSPTGQQILLGLGALLVLSAATFFGVVVWMIVGVWGQAALLCTMTALAVLGTVLATRRRLPAAAETGAVLASGLTVVGLWAAWSLDLAGLGRISSTLYATLAALVGAALVLGYDRLVPRRAPDGQPLRRVVTFRPVATAALSLAPWFLLAELDLTGVGVVAGWGLVALLSGALWFGTRLLDPHAPSILPPALSTVLAAVIYVVVGLGVAHDLDVPTREGSAVLMVASAALVAFLAARVPVGGRLAGLVPVVATIIAALAAWSFTWEMEWMLLVAVAVITAVAAVVLAYAPFPPGTTDSIGHRCGQVVLAAAGAGLVLELFILHVVDEPTLFGNQSGEGPVLGLVARVAGLWVLASLAVAVRLRSLLWLVFSHLALTVALGLAVADSSVGLATAVWLVAGALLAAAAAGLMAWIPPTRGPLSGWDLVPSLFAAAFAAVAVATSTELGHPWTAWTLIATGVVAFAFSLLPDRLVVAYVAAPVISYGVGLLATDAGWDVIEAFAWPLAALLAVIGWLHWRRDRAISSRVSMGPAAGVALLPSVVVAIEDGDPLRLLLGTLAATILLVVGLTRQLQALVAVGGAALALIAVTQGGPYIALLPGWLTLGVAGFVLLAVGVSWERAVVAGRRGSVWFAHLR